MRRIQKEKSPDKTFPFYMFFIYYLFVWRSFCCYLGAAIRFAAIRPSYFGPHNLGFAALMLAINFCAF